ncbi:UNVERIFIED_CONTAM: hypothetical protein Cloal_3658 [Acetivibrio alkalicellulosi]
MAVIGQKLVIDAKGGRKFKMYHNEWNVRVKMLKEG